MAIRTSESGISEPPKFFPHAAAGAVKKFPRFPERPALNQILWRPAGGMGFLGAYHARRPGRDRRSQQCRLDDVAQSADRRADARYRRGPARHQSRPGNPRSAPRNLDPEQSLTGVLTGGSGDTVTVGGHSRHVIGYMKDFLFRPEQTGARLELAPVAAATSSLRD